MALDLEQERQQVHALLDLLPPIKLAVVHALLKVMVNDDEDPEERADDELNEADRHALHASDQYFRNGGQGIPFEQVVADLGFYMNQIRGAPTNE